MQEMPLDMTEIFKGGFGTQLFYHCHPLVLHSRLHFSQYLSDSFFQKSCATFVCLRGFGIKQGEKKNHLVYETHIKIDFHSSQITHQS